MAAAYLFPQKNKTSKVSKKQVLLVASGDLRASANQKCWPAQAEMEAALTVALANAGYELVRAHPYKEAEGHGFISSQAEGMRVFAGIDPKAPLIVAESVWQYSHHVLPGVDQPRGAHFDGRQLVGHVARVGGHVESEWFAHQSGCEVFDAVE